MIKDSFDKSIYKKGKSPIFIDSDEKRNQEERIELLLTVFLFLGDFCPIYYNILPGFIRVTIKVLWFCYTIYFLFKSNYKRKILLNLIPLLLLIFILCLKVIVSNNFTFDFWSPMGAVLDMYYLAYAIVFAYVMLSVSIESRKFLLKFYLIVFAISVLPSYFYVAQFPDAIRDQTGQIGLIDFNFIYVLLPISGLCLSLLRYSKNKKIKIISTITLILSVGIVAVANYATALLLLVLLLLLLILLFKKMKAKSLILLFFLGCILVLLLRKPIAQLLFSFSKLSIFSGIMEYRLQDVARLLESGYVGSSFSARINLMRTSWNSFLSYPILGIPFSQFRQGTIGLHETWLSVLGYSGIIGIFVVLYAIFGVVRVVFSSIKSERMRQAYIIILFVMLILSFLNPVLSKTICVTVFGIIPCGDFYVGKEIHMEKRVGSVSKYNSSDL